MFGFGIEAMKLNGHFLTRLSMILKNQRENLLCGRYQFFLNENILLKYFNFDTQKIIKDPGPGSSGLDISRASQIVLQDKTRFFQPLVKRSLCIIENIDTFAPKFFSAQTRADPFPDFDKENHGIVGLRIIANEWSAWHQFKWHFYVY